MLGDCYFCGYKTSCVVEGTLITLASGEQVPVEELTGEEKLLVWDMNTGSYTEADIVYIVDHGRIAEKHEIMHLYFSDGTDMGIIYDHGFYDLDLNKMLYINANNYEEYIGHWFVAQKADSVNEWNKVQLTNVEIEYRTTTAYEVITYEHLTCFTNGLLSIGSLLNPFCNIFEVDEETLSYNKEQMAKDIEKYGLFTYEDFKGKMPDYSFMLYRLDYLKVSIGKGITTWEEIETLIQYYHQEIDPIVKDSIKNADTGENLISAGKQQLQYSLDNGTVRHAHRRASSENYLPFKMCMNCINDGRRPTGNAIQVEFPNHFKVLYSKDMVLSVKEKATESCQVSITEMNVNKSSM